MIQLKKARGKTKLSGKLIKLALSENMKVYVLFIIGLIISITCLIVSFTFRQFFFLPLFCILPLGGTCFSKKRLNDDSLQYNTPYNPANDHFYIIKCPNCERIISEEHPRYCPHCGTELT
jgi:hypothetical protein